MSPRSTPAWPATSLDDGLQLLSYVLGWAYTAAWSLSFYPQPLLNYRRRSTSGTTPAFPVLNTLGFAAYSASTLAFYASRIVQQQYSERHGGAHNTVRGNDVAFALHALLLSMVTLSQFWAQPWGFERRKWKLGRGIWGVLVGCHVGLAWTLRLVVSDQTGWQAIDVVYALGYVKLFVTVIKYIPQAWENYIHQSTVGWSISQILMDLLGGILSIGQLALDSSLQGDWSGVAGNPVKFALGNVSIIFDIVFMLQHYVLYRNQRREDGPSSRKSSYQSID